MNNLIKSLHNAFCIFDYYDTCAVEINGGNGQCTVTILGSFGNKQITVSDTSYIISELNSTSQSGIICYRIEDVLNQLNGTNRTSESGMSLYSMYENRITNSLTDALDKVDFFTKLADIDSDLHYFIWISRIAKSNNVFLFHNNNTLFNINIAHSALYINYELIHLPDDIRNITDEFTKLIKSSDYLVNTIVNYLNSIFDRLKANPDSTIIELTTKYQIREYNEKLLSVSNDINEF